METRTAIQGSACGLGAVVEASSVDGITVHLRLESDCPKVRALAAALTQVDAVEEILRRSLVETTPARLAGEYHLHTSCLVPVGVLKAIEATAGLALPTASAIEVARVG